MAKGAARRAYPARLRAAAALVLSLAPGCHTASHSGAAARPSAPASAARARAPVRWELADSLPSLRSVAVSAPSEHLGGSVDGDIRINERAAPYPALGPAHPAQLGAVIVEAHHPHGAADVNVYFAMVKREPGFSAEGGDWEYLVLDRAATVVERGTLPLCARCHADAPYDHLFGRSR